MKYELAFNLLLVRLKGRECNRRLAFWTKAESVFPKSKSKLVSRGLTDQGIIHHYLLTRVTTSQMELLNAITSMELSSYQKANAW